jgi:hypothetical protein
MSEENGLATANQLFNSVGRRRYEELTIPTSGLRVRIRSLTELELSRYQSATIASTGTGLKRSKLEDASRRLIVLCLVDGEGNPLLRDRDVARLAEWDSADTSFLYEECAKHCGINRQDVGELVKNSEETPGDLVHSDSPSE